MQNFWQWLVRSSSDPSKIALTVKGALGTIVSLVLAFSPLFHLNVGQDQLNVLVDALVQIVVIGAAIVSGIATIAGLARKIFFMFHPASADPIIAPVTKSA